MADFDDEFRLCTDNKHLAQFFADKINEFDDVSIEWPENCENHTIKMIGAPFGRSSQWAAKKMAKLLLDCIEAVPEASFTASYSLDDYHGSDQAEVTYAYSGATQCMTMNGDFAEYQVEHEEEDCEGKTFAISGELKEYEDHEELVDIIESLEAGVSEHIDRSIDFLICNDALSDSSRLAAELGIPVLTEADFIKRFLDAAAYDDNFSDSCYQSYRITEEYHFHQETKKWSNKKSIEVD